MEIRDLIRELTEIAEDYGDDVEVRWASQPSWPFENAIGSVVAVDLNADGESDNEEWYRGEYESEDAYFARLQELREAGHDEGEGDGDENVVVYLEEARQIGYLPGAAAEALGW
jgi:hypothetical protein